MSCETVPTKINHFHATLSWETICMAQMSKDFKHCWNKLSFLQHLNALRLVFYSLGLHSLLRVCNRRRTDSHRFRQQWCQHTGTDQFMCSEFSIYCTDQVITSSDVRTCMHAVRCSEIHAKPIETNLSPGARFAMRFIGACTAIRCFLFNPLNLRPKQ
jgi:hypothetical protein